MNHFAQKILIGVVAFSLGSAVAFSSNPPTVLDRLESLITTIVQKYGRDSVTQTMQETCDTSAQTHNVVECEEATFVFQDRRLNFVWQEIRRQNSRLSETLRESQRVFIRDRNAAALRGLANTTYDRVETLKGIASERGLVIDDSVIN